MSHDLPELMQRAVRDEHPDLGGLAHAARRRGLGIRRRRQALGLVGAATAVAVVWGGVQVVGTTPDGTAASQNGGSVTATGASTAAALTDALDALDAGTATEPAGRGGQGPGQLRGETFAQVLWNPYDGSAPSVVQVSVRPAQEAGDDSCDAEPATTVDCAVRRLASGELVKVTEQVGADAPGSESSSVVVVRVDGVRVAAGASNGVRIDADTWQTLRERSALDVDQLTRIARWPALGLRVDAARSDPEGYLDLDLNPGRRWLQGPVTSDAVGGPTRAARGGKGSGTTTCVRCEPSGTGSGSGQADPEG